MKKTIASLAILASLAGVPAYASHHFETPLAREHPQYDLTDLYVFASDRKGSTTLMIDANPQTAKDSKQGDAAFGADGIYNIHVGADRKLSSGHTYTFSFNDGSVTVSKVDGANPDLDAFKPEGGSV